MVLTNIRRIFGGYMENVRSLDLKSSSDEENIRKLSLSPICIRSSGLVLFWIWRKWGPLYDITNIFQIKHSERL